MDEETFHRYAAAHVPRYTSYPTALQFRPAADDAAWRGWLAALPAQSRLSLYLHVPYCRTLCWYCGCHTRGLPREAPLDPYTSALLGELKLLSNVLGEGRSLSHLHWGGGTPSVLGTARFAAVMKKVAETFIIEPGAELAMELDPRSLDVEMAEALRAAGINRASLGVQTTDPAVQAAIGRVQPIGTVRSAVARLRAAGISAISMDIMYGLPRQTVASVRQTAADIIALSPQRVSAFGYAHVPWMKRHQGLIRTEDLPGVHMRGQQAEVIAKALLGAGYVRIGLDHFALPDDGLAVAAREGRLRRNFQGYTDDPADALIGVGASAISRLPQGYSQNATDILRYQTMVRAGRFAVSRQCTLADDDRLRAGIIEELMCHGSTDPAAYAARAGLPVPWPAESLERLRADGLIEIENTTIRMKPGAETLVRVVAAQFDAYRAPEETRHAVAV